MVDIKKILYPTDLSKHSAVALPYAVDLAKHYNAQLHCINILDSGHEFFLEGGYIAPLALKASFSIEQMQKTAQEHLESFLKENIPSMNNNVMQKVILGKPFVEIIHYARQEHIDLIVLGTHGHSALASMLLGSVAEKVVRKSPCPVFTVRHPEHKFEAP